MDFEKIEDLPEKQKEQVIEMEFNRLFKEIRKEFNETFKELQNEAKR